MAVSEGPSTIASWTRHHRGRLPPNALCRAPGGVVTGSSAPGAEGASAQSDAPKAASPYSSGAGSVRLEHRVGPSYLALLLTGDGAAELGEGAR
jgi:hypothetical protein